MRANHWEQFKPSPKNAAFVFFSTFVPIVLFWWLFERDTVWMRACVLNWCLILNLYGRVIRIWVSAGGSQKKFFGVGDFGGFALILSECLCIFRLLQQEQIHLGV